MRRARIAGWLLAVAVAMVSVVGSATADSDVAPSPRLQDSYDLGMAVFAPAAALVRFDETVKRGHLSEEKMVSLAEETRTAELTDFHGALGMLRRMGAPEEVDRPFVAAVDTLAAPLVISDKSKIAFPKDPVAQRIWSTLDEADEIAPDEAAQLAPWLKLSHGRDGLWAYRLGCLIASERASIPGALWKLPLIDSAQALASSAPLSTPQYMIDALQDVANEAKAHELMPDCLHTLDHAAATLFGSPRS